MEPNNYLVCVRCMTFNHAPFIVDALNGFTMQQTTFPFVCTIVDDCSTDGEPEVILQYMKDYFNLDDPAVVRREETDDYRLVFARHKTNDNCYFAVLLLKYNHYSIKKTKLPYLSEWLDNAKYHALCEGDDYWNNPDKLQLQVDFLETHPDYVLCYGDALRFNSDNGKYRGSIARLSRRNNLKETTDKEERFYKVLNGFYHIQTLTALYRRSATKNRPKEKYHFMMGDTNLWLHLSQQGNFHYLDTCLGVYNLHAGSATHNSSTKARFALSMYEMRCYYCNEYGYEIPDKVKKNYNRALINNYMQQIEVLPPPPIYSPFNRNCVQWTILKAILIRSRFYKFYLHIVHPVRSRLIYLGTRVKLAERLVFNALP